MELAGELPSLGPHLTAARLAVLAERPVLGGRRVAASCQNAADLTRAATLDLDYALLAPVQTTASHPYAEPLGWNRFGALVDRAGLPVYALGGLTPADIDQVIDLGAQGIAVIRGLLVE